MEHYAFKSERKFNNEAFNQKITEAMNFVVKQYETANFELAERSINKNFNSYTGKFERYNIIHNSMIIGFLEAFRDGQGKYMNIYTSPL